MRVAIFVSYLPPHIGGIETATEGQIKALLGAQQEVEAITSACGSKPGVNKSSDYTLRRLRAWNFSEKNMSAAFPVFAPSLLWHSYRAAKRSDILHAHDALYITSFAAAFWSRILRKPLILTQHIDISPHPKTVVRIAQKIAYATVGKFVMNSSTKIIVLNSRVKTFLMSNGLDESKIIFLPNSIDIKLFSPVNEERKIALRQKYNLPIDKQLVLFVGRFVGKKGFSKLTKLKPIDNVAFVFVGGDIPKGKRRSDHFFLGTINHDDIDDVFKLSDLFVLPSEAEGFPVTIQEAMASGLPIITTDDPSYNLYGFNSEQMLMVEPIMQNIRDEIKAVANSSAKKADMAKYSHAYAVKNFSSTLYIKKLLNIYESALS